MSIADIRQPILLELDEQQWGRFLDNAETWLWNVTLTQASFRKLAEDTAAKITDPRIREQIACIAEAAQGHEARVDALYRAIGRQPARGAAGLGALTAKGREVLGDMVGATGSAPGPWHDLRQMLLSNLDAMGAFGAVEQVGLALGLPELAKIAFEVVRDKSTHQLLIQEYVLEMAPLSILYDQAL